MRMCHFWAQNGPFALNKNFIGKNYYYHLHLPIGPCHCAKFLKNSYSGSRVMRMLYFGAQNDPLAQMTTFFRKPVNKPCSFKSKSGINILMK